MSLWFIPFCFLSLFIKYVGVVTLNRRYLIGDLVQYELFKQYETTCGVWPLMAALKNPLSRKVVGMWLRRRAQVLTFVQYTSSGLRHTQIFWSCFFIHIFCEYFFEQHRLSSYYKFTSSLTYIFKSLFSETLRNI